MDKIKHNWSNKDNLPFYQSLSLDIPFNSAALEGFDTGCDIDVIAEYIDQSNSILDVGAGYGRALAHIICRGYRGKLCGIEHCDSMYKFMHALLWRRIHAIHADIKQVQLEEHFDLIICLWATFCDFTQAEQASLMLQFADWLPPGGGHIVIDTMPKSTQELLGTNVTSDTHVIEKLTETQGRVYCYGYFPSPQDMANYAKNAHLDIIRVIDYKTTTGQAQTMYVLAHSQ